jgi:uncharacterized repeat protein (TIGR01451 family)
MKRVGLLGLRLAMLVVLALTVIGEAPKAQAETSVDVTFTITRLEEVHCDEDPPEACPNDYYPSFKIDDEEYFDGEEMFCCVEETDFWLNWAHTYDVKSSHNPVQIHVELWDDDDFSPDNIVDIAPGEHRSLDLTFDLNTCTFQGADLTAEQGAGIPGMLQGQSSGGPEESARITFTITTPACLDNSYKIDSDGDGLPNGWEITGLDIQDPNVQLADLRVLPVVDGKPDLDLGKPPFSANPIHKDLFVEVDWMADATHNHEPQPGVLDDVIKAFADAPVGNPNDIDGITLHAMKDESMPDQADISFRTHDTKVSNDFDDFKLGLDPKHVCLTGHLGTAKDRADLNCSKILAAKSMVFRYMIFGHSYSEISGSSGNAEGGVRDDSTRVSGNDFIVTVDPAFSANVINGVGGKRVVEAGTFMHELGHTLGLDHGGGDRINCKPNYLSVMNYTLQIPILNIGAGIPQRPLDYSRRVLDPLNENGALDETKGIGGPAGWPTVYGVGGKQTTARANAASIDWNEKDGLEKKATADINFISTIGPSSKDGGCDTASPNETLSGFDDWNSIIYSFRDSPYFNDGVRGPVIPELTADTVQAMSAQADLKIAKSVDKAIASGGDALNYSVPVTNVGRGKAIGVLLTDTLPDGSTQTRALPDLDADASNTQAFTFVVPCATEDGALLTNRASVSGTDESGIPDPDLSDNAAQASTTVHAPVLTLSKTATASVNAGEAIIYTITYANTGGGAAANVVITDVLPAGVYYSKALDLGAGPKPDTVTLNADGTRTLVWNVGTVAASSGPQTIVFTARPTLLALGGTSYSNNVSLSFQNANGCVFDTLEASSSTSITVVPPTRDPQGLGFWRTHPELQTAEILARIQATDQRFDGADGTTIDGALSAAEVTAVLVPGGNMDKVLEEELIGTYFNLAMRRINAGTRIDSRLAGRLGLATVRDAALYSQATLALPVNSANRARFSDATTVLGEINNNKSEVY